MIFRLMGVDVARFLAHYGEDSILGDEVSQMIRNLHNSREYDLPRAKVWEGLRDLTRAPRYVPNLTGVEILTEQTEGVGASRRVFQKNGKPLDETVEEWEDGYGFKLRLHNGDKPPAPFPEAWFDYRIADAPDGGTFFRPALIYGVPAGIFGKLMNALPIRRFSLKIDHHATELAPGVAPGGHGMG